MVRKKAIICNKGLIFKQPVMIDNCYFILVNEKNIIDAKGKSNGKVFINNSIFYWEKKLKRRWKEIKKLLKGGYQLLNFNELDEFLKGKEYIKESECYRIENKDW